MNIYKNFKLLCKCVKQGLNLIEAMLAILVVGITVTAVIGLQGALWRTTATSHAIISRIASLKNMFVQAEREKWYNNKEVHEQHIEDPAMHITYTPIAYNNKNFANVILERIEGDWKVIRGTQSEIFISFKFVPPKTKIETKSEA